MYLFPYTRAPFTTAYAFRIHLQCLGRVDSSGVRIYYTDKLRKHDSGIVSVGVKVNNWHIIPPKQKDWLSIGYCTAECTEVWYHLILCGA